MFDYIICSNKHWGVLTKRAWVPLTSRLNEAGEGRGGPVHLSTKRS